MHPRCPQIAKIAFGRRTGGVQDRGMARAKDAVGAYGERVAVEYLVAQGMTLVARNWRCAAGEIDAVLLDRETLVFCEVKTRRRAAHGQPYEAVGYRKMVQLRRLAAIYLGEAGDPVQDVRFDVVSVIPQAAGAAAVEHLPGAF
jgi:putative endonuclease